MESQEAGISLFSFGPIKTCSAFWGTVAAVRRPELSKRMQEIQDVHPVQREGVFGKRVAKYTVLKAVSDSRWLYGLFVAKLEMGEWDVHVTITVLGRSSSPGVALKEQVRVKPSAAPLDLLLFQLRGPHTRELESKRGDQFVRCWSWWGDVDGKGEGRAAVVLVMNACIFWPNIHSIHKRAKNIHILNAYNEYSLGELYHRFWHSVIINCRCQCLPVSLPDS